ncbi:hypothetical protein [Paraburkholderia silvatlantica]|uniref:hypothetical protein n=1 Tax=Paraburkholderia silvatlantica TaxID=321895 RepID=UPI00375195F3
MLISIDTLQDIIYIPHEREYRAWKARLSDEQYRQIESEIAIRIGGGEVHTAGWLPGNDWSDTPFDPIWSIACERDHVASGLFFGLIVWVFMQKHGEAWAFGRYAKNGVPIRSLTYFRVTLQRPLRRPPAPAPVRTRLR